MKLAFYFFIIAQIVNFLGVFAEKVTKDSSEFNPVRWEKVRENKEKPLKKIIWKSYKDDKSYFEKINLKNKSKKNLDKAQKESSTWRNRTLRFSFEEIDMPDAGETWVCTVLGHTNYSNLGYTAASLFTVQRADAVVVFLLVAIPWEWNVS